MTLDSYTVNITPTAEQDLKRRYRQIADESPQNALHWYRQMVAAMQSLDRLAERCPIAPEDADIKVGIRHLNVGNYRVLYCVRGRAVDILHLRHGSMERVLG